MRAIGKRSLLVSALLVAACVSASPAQMSDFDSPQPASMAETAPQRKKPSMFRRPSMESPAQQLTYAETLAAEGRTRRAARQFRNLVHAWHESPQALEAQMAYARLLEERGKLGKAFDEYQYLIDRFAGRFPYDEVLDRQLRIANTIATDRHWEFLFLPGFEAPERAIPLYARIVENAPQWERVPEIQFRIAVLHDELGEDDKAIEAYGRVFTRYPGSEFAAAAAFGRAECLFRVAMKRVRDEKPLRDALMAFHLFLHDYPLDERVPDARARIGEARTALAGLAFDRAAFYDRGGRRPAAARIEYERFLREFHDMPRAAAARKRLAELAAEGEDAP